MRLSNAFAPIGKSSRRKERSYSTVIAKHFTAARPESAWLPNPHAVKFQFMDGRQWLSNGIGNAFRPYLRRVRAPRRYRAIDAEADRATATGAFENPLALKTHSNPAPSSSEASELRSCCVPPANAPPLTPTAVIHPKDRPRRKGPPYRPLFEIGRNGAKPDSIVMTLSERLAEGCYSAASALGLLSGTILKARL